MQRGLLGPVVMAVLASTCCTACVSSGASAGSGLTEQACSVTAEGFTVCEPSAPLPPGATPRPPLPVVRAATYGLAGVRLGMPAAEATQRLQALLGRPSVEENSCLRPEQMDSLDVPVRGQKLVWPYLSAFLTPSSTDGLVLAGWEVTPPPSDVLARYDVRLPYGTQLGQRLDEVREQLVQERSYDQPDGRDAGAAVVADGQVRGLMWISVEDGRGEEVVHSVALDPEGCR